MAYYDQKWTVGGLPRLFPRWRTPPPQSPLTIHTDHVSSPAFPGYRNHASVIVKPSSTIPMLHKLGLTNHHQVEATIPHPAIFHTIIHLRHNASTPHIRFHTPDSVTSCGSTPLMASAYKYN